MSVTDLPIEVLGDAYRISFPIFRGIGRVTGLIVSSFQQRQAKIVADASICKRQRERLGAVLSGDGPREGDERRPGLQRGKDAGKRACGDRRRWRRTRIDGI